MDDESQLVANIIPQAFAARVRTGFYGKGHQVKLQSVSEALVAISKTCELAGQSSPVYRADQKYQRGIEAMIEGMRRQDPLPRLQLAVLLVKVVKVASKIAQGSDDRKMYACTDLMMILFYYLLRSGECTKPKFRAKKGKRRKATRTVQFRVKDVYFFDGCFSIKKIKMTLKELLCATTVTLRMHAQKNGRMEYCIMQEAIPNGPTQALVRRVHHILSNGGNGDSLLCKFCQPEGTWDCVQSSDVVRQMRVITKLLRIMDKQ